MGQFWDGDDDKPSNPKSFATLLWLSLASLPGVCAFLGQGSAFVGQGSGCRPDRLQLNHPCSVGKAT